MGTPEFAVEPLRALHESEHEVVAVVTAPDNPAGRGRKPRPSAVKQAALELDLPVLQPEKLRDESFVQALKNLNADVFVVVAFRMLPKVVWTLPSKGTFNLHASLLPNYRGAAPIHWAVINGEKESGVTTFMIDEEIDTGNILLQEKTSIDPNETTGSLYNRLMHLGAPLVVKTVDGLMKGDIAPISQDESAEMKPAPKIFREHQYIDVKESAQAIHNHIRGLNPFPAPLLKLDHHGEQVEVKVADSAFIERKQYPKALLHWLDDALVISRMDGDVLIKEIQWPGKRKMSVRDFKNGFAEYAELKTV
ncbi:MAG: methionyl-tRNA formyltransferase [Flavobacteriia bacterium]|nr:methionyl-tRNA formyltransferase [Flavobacteriia bacterium]